jgi:hypothetical protein
MKRFESSRARRDNPKIFLSLPKRDGPDIGTREVLSFEKKRLTGTGARVLRKSAELPSRAYGEAEQPSEAELPLAVYASSKLLPSWQ